MLAVEGRACMPGDIDRAHHPATHGIEGVQPVSRRKPDVSIVKRHPAHLVGIGEGAILTEDFGCRPFHLPSLVTRQRAGE